MGDCARRQQPVPDLDRAAFPQTGLDVAPPHRDTASWYHKDVSGSIMSIRKLVVVLRGKQGQTGWRIRLGIG